MSKESGSGSPTTQALNPHGSCLLCGHHRPFAVFVNGRVDDPLRPVWVGCCEECRSLRARLALAEAAADALRSLPPPATLATVLELDGPEPAPRKVAGFLRHYAGIIRKNERWDIPETMARAYESAAMALEQYAEAAEAEVARLTQARDSRLDALVMTWRKDAAIFGSEGSFMGVAASQALRRCADELELAGAEAGPLTADPPE